ncbi:hypothetical protein BX666DRAFT_408213 [Dichotomocladium elegans]|nr:hypothetical protein BX666DRAFT_408213 [Dichotomocladium elegans]
MCTDMGRLPCQAGLHVPNGSKRVKCLLSIVELVSFLDPSTCPVSHCVPGLTQKKAKCALLDRNTYARFLSLSLSLLLSPNYLGPSPLFYSPFFFFISLLSFFPPSPGGTFKQARVTGLHVIMTTPASNPIWFEIIDPNTSQHYYANPNTGKCLWDAKPATASIKFADPNGDWWELWDGKNQLPYYYHTRTKETRWTRPDNESTVISLIKVQEQSSTASKRLSIKEPPRIKTAIQQNGRTFDLLTAKRPIPQRSTSDTGSVSATKTDGSFGSQARLPAMTRSTTTSTTNIPAAVTAAVESSANRRRTHFARSKASIESAFINFTRGHRAEKKDQKREQQHIL